MSMYQSAALGGNTSSHSIDQLFSAQIKGLQGLVLFVLWVGLAAYPTIAGFEYYSIPLVERPYSDLHESFKPSGFIGQGLGILGTLMMLVGVVSYMIRKRWTVAQRFGKLRNWLTFHIFLCTLGPYFVLLHTTFKFGNIASISFWSMAIVVGSGIFGRYVYIRIPKTLNGQFLSPQVIAQAEANMVKRLARMTGLTAAYIQAAFPAPKNTNSIVVAIVHSMRFSVEKRQIKNRFEKALRSAGIESAVIKEAVPLFTEHAQLQMRMKLTKPFVRGFGYWHVLHIPLALVMLVALIIHIGVALAFGYTWIL